MLSRTEGRNADSRNTDWSDDWSLSGMNAGCPVTNYTVTNRSALHWNADHDAQTTILCILERHLEIILVEPFQSSLQV